MRRLPCTSRGLWLAALLAPATPSVAAQEPGTSGSPAPVAAEAVWRVDLHAGATAPPLASGDRVYVAAARREVKAFDLRGRELWSRRLGRGFAAPPVLVDRILIVASARPEAKAYGLDPRTGETRWEREVGDVVQRPVVEPTRAVFVSAGGRITALEPRSGKPLWETRLEGVFAGGAVLRGDDLVLLSANGVLYRLDARTGERRGSRSLGAPALPTLVELPDEGRFLTVTEAGRMRAFGFDLAPLGFELEAGALAHPPVAGGGRLLAPGADRVLRGFSLETGKRLWERSFPVAFATAPAMSPDATVVAVGDLAGGVWILEVATGGVLSRTQQSGAAVPVWSPAGLLVVTDRGTLALLKTVTPSAAARQ